MINYLSIVLLSPKSNLDGRSDFHFWKDTIGHRLFADHFTCWTASNPVKTPT